MTSSSGRQRVVVALLSLIVSAVMMLGCQGDEAETPGSTLPHAMKGYELYSWYEGAGWQYALVVGTNRLKTYDEVAARAVRVEGIDALKDELSRLPEGEQVFWSAGRVPGTTHPPAQTVNAVRTFCDQNGIRLEVDGEGG